MDVLTAFLQQFVPKRICAVCLAQVTDEPYLHAERRLEAMVRDGAVSLALGPCTNCLQTLPTYSLG